MKRLLLSAVGACGLFLLSRELPAAPARGWLSWRGPQQNGVSLEKGLPDTLAVKDALWRADFTGASTPVIANGRLYIMGYLGQGPELKWGVACFDAETGQKLWDQSFSDFLSDTITCAMPRPARPSIRRPARFICRGRKAFCRVDG